jgi:hypothetical protein
VYECQADIKVVGGGLSNKADASDWNQLAALALKSAIMRISIPPEGDPQRYASCFDDTVNVKTRG